MKLNHLRMLRWRPVLTIISEGTGSGEPLRNEFLPSFSRPLRGSHKRFIGEFIAPLSKVLRNSI